MYGVCTEDWHYPRDVAWYDATMRSMPFLPDSGERMRLSDNSFHGVSHVWSSIETLHRPSLTGAEVDTSLVGLKGLSSGARRGG